MKNKGFGLVEVLVSSAILALVVGGSIALMRSSLRRTVLASDRTVAMNLAQEAIEGVRVARDTTYTDQISNDWTANIGGDSPGSGSYRLNVSTLGGQGSLYGLVAGDEIISVNGIDFKREILVSVPNFANNANIRHEGAIVNDAQIIRRIEVVVTWGESTNSLQKITAETYLTDWRGGI